jgi:hypothetical protein
MMSFFGTVLDFGVKERYAEDVHTNVLRADTLWDIGVARKCTSPNSKTIYQSLKMQDLKITSQPVTERKRALLEAFSQQPEEGADDDVQHIHKDAKRFLIMRYLGDRELQKEMKGLPLELAGPILSGMSEAGMGVPGTSLPEELTQYITGDEDQISSVLKLAKTASKAANPMAGSLKFLSTSLCDDKSQSKKRFMSLMEQAKHVANDGQELSALRGIFDKVAADNDYDSALDCHQQMLLLEDTKEKQYTVAITAVDGSPTGPYPGRD